MPLRIGILGAAKVVSLALLPAAREVPEVTIRAIAARDPDRARTFAQRHRIPVVHDTYRQVIDDPEIDVVYIALPNGLHGRWAIAALQAGKHVLCEKPFTANAEEAEAVVAVARRSGRVLMEAVHYRYHALTQRALAIVASGELGTMRHIDTWFSFFLPAKDIRWNFSLAGGALIDPGSYMIDQLRLFGGADPTVRAARAKTRLSNIDQSFEAEFDFADGRTGTLRASMRGFPDVGYRIVGTEGSLTVFNPVFPHIYNHLTVRSAAGKRRERLPRQPSSYLEQLRAFAGAILRGAPLLSTHEDSIANMRLIDACYAAAGLPRREPTPG